MSIIIHAHSSIMVTILNYIFTGPKPNVTNVDHFQTLNGPICIPQRIVNYKPFGNALLEDPSGVSASALENQHNKVAESINRDIIFKWVNGQGQPIEWSILIEVLELPAVNSIELARLIAEAVQ